MWLRRHLTAASSALSLSLLAWRSRSVRGDFGDYVDGDWNCPVRTTCPVVCVRGGEGACPTRCPSRDDGATDLRLCPDGSCRESCPDGEPENPCPPCASTACAKVNDFYDTCLERFEAFYQAAESCEALSNEQESSSSSSTFRTAAPSAVLWLFAVTVLTFLWTAYNARSKQQAAKPLEEGEGHRQTTVTGYRTNVFGTLLFTATVITMIGFQLLILAFAIASYKQNTEREALRAFEVVWSIGFLWTLLFKWPYSIRTVYLQQCPLYQATQVCVSATTERQGQRSMLALSQRQKREPTYIVQLRRISTRLSSLTNRIMSFLFSSASAPGHGRMEYVAVQIDETDQNTRYFLFEFRRYNYDPEQESFVPAKIAVAHTIGDIVDAKNGLSTDQVQHRLRIVGPNSIEMKQPKLWSCIVDEFSKPFYCYQNFMLWTWVPLYYYYMAIIHGSVIVVGGITVSWFRYRNERNLYKFTHVTGDTQVLRDGQLVTISQSQLVPGDIVIVAPGTTYSDMVMVSSEGLLVDESALTGESTPMAKTAVDPLDREQPYNPLLVHKKHTIWAGTTVLESEVENNLALVVSTGSFTSKGKLLQEVFSYERHQFKFDVEVGFVIAILFLEAIVGFALVVSFIQEQPLYAWFYGMYVVSTLLPPLLPTVFTVSVGISENRLNQKHIACANSEDILVAGKVTRAFFDKTGTLTRQGLDFISAKCRATWEDNNESTTDLSADLTLAMACCHGLTRSQQTGDLIGNPVDRTMFEASGAAILSDVQGSSKTIVDRYGTTVEVVKYFDFDHHRMSQSVIAKRPDGSLIAFVKGSCEKLQQLCLPESLPNNYESVVRESAKSGTYQISVACKVIPQHTDVNLISRDDVERDLSFVGVINFKNSLREETPEVIRHLEAGEVKCVMVTGDSLLTGIRIAKESGMIKEGLSVLSCSKVEHSGVFAWLDENHIQVDLPPIEHLKSGDADVELAVTGDVWEELRREDPLQASELAHAIRVYGRCTPFDKVSVVSTFVEMGFITLMVGDGGNDCGALKTAHVGIALSDAEASMVSPFTSLSKSIDSVAEILKEGRCALASALASYKYVIIYGQIEALTNIIMAYFRINLTEYAWVFIDGFWVIGMSFTLPLAKAARHLSQTRPTSSLLGPHTVSSVMGILCLNVVFTFVSIGILFSQDWFQCRKWSNEDVSNLLVIGDNYEAATIFLVTGYQYVSTAAAFNFGYEWRQNWFRNYYFVLLVVIFTVIHFWATLVPGELSCLWRVNCENVNVLYSVTSGKKVPIQNPFNTTLMPASYRWTLVIIMITNAVANMGWDYVVVNGIRKKVAARRREKQAQFAPAKNVDDDIVAETV